MTCKLIINKHKNICAGVYGNEVNFPDSKLPRWSNDWRHTTQSRSDLRLLYLLLYILTCLNVWCHNLQLIV